MGNTESNVTSGVKKQADTSSIQMYKLVDLKGGGLLVELMKRAAQTKQYAELDHAIKTKVEPFLYNKGKGKLIPVAQLVLMRNKERPRHKMLPPLKGLENPDDYDVESYPAPECHDEVWDKNKYREVCWVLNERGAVGETILLLCLLNATSIHADLAKRLLKFYPKLINDIYMSDEYYGENVLHIAIVNEDPSMVKFLLDSGVDFHERCIGNFMCAEDQKASRTDSLDHEWVNLNPMTNYEGYVYWGEYPLSFAACLGQEECYRLMLARGANPDNQDTNGNTVLHMLVIYSKISMFDTAYELGANLSIKNRLYLTPLTLAAKLARIEMFFHIMNIEREIYWQIGSITCAAYPLEQIDTIDIETGNISKDSALNLVVFGEKDDHLELMDGVLVDLLHAKWNAFVKFRFYRQFFLFFIYFLISLLCFTLRPGPVDEETTTSTPSNITDLLNDTLSIDLNTTNQFDSLIEGLQKTPVNLSKLISNTMLNESHVFLLSQLISEYNTSTLSYGPRALRFEKHSDWAMNTSGFVKSSSKATLNGTALDLGKNMTKEGKQSKWVNHLKRCRLLQIKNHEDIIRIGAEIFLEIGSVLYILAALREARFLGWSMFVENLMTAPSRVMFLFSCFLMLSMPFFRFKCDEETEDIMAVIIMLTTAPYFLFFCRGFKTVGPFVVMIYRMIMGDLLRFATIYMVFVLGFSQAFYLIFLSFDNPLTPDGVDDTTSNLIPNPVEAVMAMFFLSLTNFGDYYAAFERTGHEIGAKILFVVYMGIVAVLLVNMLIAMMGNTYQKIAETKNEWQRQWARIVLVVERGVPPADRLAKLMWYSEPMSDGRRALVLRLNQSEEDKEEMKECLEMKRVHKRMVLKRQQKLKEMGLLGQSQQGHSPNKLINLNSPSQKKPVI